MARLTEEQIRWFRLRRSGLVEPFASPEAAAASLAGVQAQILPAALPRAAESLRGRRGDGSRTDRAPL